MQWVDPHRSIYLHLFIYLFPIILIPVSILLPNLVQYHNN
jgi:hypothetical protein